MNRRQAMKYDDELKEHLQSFTEDCSANRDMGKYIVDNFVEFLPDDDVKEMIFLGNAPASYKAGNAKLDLKKAILAGVEFVASINSPESIFNYIQLLIVSALFIGTATRQPVSRLEAYVVYWLHVNGAYQSGVREDCFVSEFQEWYQQKEGRALQREEVVRTINHLYEMKVIDFNNSEIYLKEKVFGTME